MRPQGVALPIINCAIWLRRNDKYIEDIRIVFGPSGPVPTRASAVEEVFKGKLFEKETIHSAMNVMRNTVKFRTSNLRASALYRYDLAENLLKSVLFTAWTRATIDNGG